MVPLLSRRALLAGLFALAARPAMADSGSGETDKEEQEEDHVRARRALEQGDVRPLSEILTKLEGSLDGDIVGIEFEVEGNQYIYEFKLVTPEGRLVSVYVDAGTAAILRRQEN